MSVLIRDMEMPKKCLDCPFMVSRDNDDCILQSDAANEIARTWNDLKANCPLVEVPTPHGRLIDADALNTYDVSPIYEFCVMGVTEEDIGLAETIIEAEGSDNG